MKSTKRLTLTALLCAVALVLSFIEGLFVFIPQCPGVKVGLSNIAVMFAVFCMDKKTAFSVSVLKSLFALLTRGAMAGLLSLAGGVASVIVMILLAKIFKGASVASISVFAALTHNLAQFAVISLVYAPASMLPYLPLLIISGIVFGVVNAVFLHGVRPALLRLGGIK